MENKYPDTAGVDGICAADPPPITGHPRPKHSHLNGKIRVASLDDLDARTRTARLARELISAFEADLGGDLSTAKKQIVQRAAMLGVMVADLEARWLAGEPVDQTIVATLGNAQRRLLTDLGLERVAKDITLGSILNGDSNK